MFETFLGWFFVYYVVMVIGYLIVIVFRWVYLAFATFIMVTVSPLIGIILLAFGVMVLNDK